MRVRNVLFSLGIAVVLFAGSEIVSLIGLRFLESKGLGYRPVDLHALNDGQRGRIRDLVAGRTRYVDFDPQLGWTLKGSAAVGAYATNAAGLRAGREYEPAPPAGKLRVASFGDSFVHGDDVGNDETWQAFLERKSPQLEVLNFGVSAYGLDQSYLRYLELGRRYRPRVVIIGFVSENIRRMVNAFRPFYMPGSDMPMTKPRFEIVDGRLRPVENPFTSLDDYRDLLENEREVLKRLRRAEPYLESHYGAGPLDVLAAVRLGKVLYQAYRPAAAPLVKDHFYDPDSGAFQVTLRVFEAFCRRVAQDGSIPLIVIFPTKYDMERHQAGIHSNYYYLKRVLEERRLPVLDLLEALPRDLSREEIRTYFGPTLHYGAKGNAWAAEQIFSYFMNNQILEPNHAEIPIDQ